MVRYEPGQFYRRHHDQNTAVWTPQGPRVLTFFMYLNDPEAGGETRFPSIPDPDGTPGEPQKLAEYYAVSEDKLRALPAEKLAELRDNGALGQIYAHLVSLLGWDRLIALAFLRQAQPTTVN